MKRLYAPIEKVEESDDGTLKVWGWASTGAQDDDGETIQPEAIKAALPDYLKWGAVREMHQPKAVGTAIEAEVQDDGRTWFGAHVVDPVAVKKVQNKVLKGFSVGGRVTARDEVEKTTITGIKLIEVSLVDRPANPECEIVIAKAARTPDDDLDDIAEVITISQSFGTLELLKAARDLAAKADSEEKPYGDVSYADPGYQEDGKKRYPIDTEEHIRAAWNYINKPGNAGKYTPAQVASIKRRIVSAWKKKIDKDGPPSAADKAASPDDLQKGMWNVASFAQSLESLAWLCMGTQSEADFEGDGSPIPAELREWMKEGVRIFQEMSREESDELVASLAEHAGEVIESASKGPDMKLNIAEALEKVGAKFSKETMAKLQDLADHHEKMVEHAEKTGKHIEKMQSMCKEACEKMDALMPEHKPEGNEAGGSNEADDKKNAKPDGDEGKESAASSRDDDSKTAASLAEIIKAAVAPLQAEIEKLKDMPASGAPFANQAAAEAFLKSRGITAVERDAGADGLQVQPVIKAGGTVDEGATLVKELLRPERAIARSPR